MTLFRKIFGIFQAKREPNHTFSDLDTDKSHIARLSNSIQKLQLEAKKKQLQKLKSKIEMRLMDDEIADLEDELWDDDEEGLAPETDPFNPDSLMSDVLKMVMQSKTQSQPSVIQTPSSSPPLTEEVSDDEILDMIRQIPADQIKIIKKTPMQILKPIAAQKFPGVSESVIDRAIEIIKNG